MYYPVNLRISPHAGKYGPQKTPNTDTIHAVLLLWTTNFEKVFQPGKLLKIMLKETKNKFLHNILGIFSGIFKLT